MVPAVSIPCPAGMTAAQCQMLNSAIAMLRASGNYLCNVTADVAEYQAENGNGDTVGLYIFDQPAAHPDRMGGSSYDEENEEFFNFTILFPATFTSPVEVANTLAHEIVGHQIMNNQTDESLAEYYGSTCGEA